MYAALWGAGAGDDKRGTGSPGASARQRADEAVAATTGFNMKDWAAKALLICARVAIALGDLNRAHDDAYQALLIGRTINAQVLIAETLEFLASLRGAIGGHEEAARLLGAADAIRQRTGAVRFALYQADFDAQNHRVAHIHG